MNVETGDFWAMLDGLVESATIRIDRPRGSTHPRYPELVYPYDYGFLEGTTSGDGEGIDLWRGAMAGQGLTAVVCTVDLVKRDVEIKLLLGCAAEEEQEILAFHGWGGQRGLLIRRPV